MGFGAPSLKGKALQWLAQREHSRAELQQKLQRHASKALWPRRAGRAAAVSANDAMAEFDAAGIDDGAHLAAARETAAAATADAAAAAAAAVALENAKITPLLDELAAAGLQSDTRAAQSLARVKGPRYGVHRLKQQLQAKGLAADLVADTIGAARATEFERAQALWLRRYGQVAQDLAERLRQIRFLTARGFDSDVVRRVVRGAADTD